MRDFTQTPVYSLTREVRIGTRKRILCQQFHNVRFVVHVLASRYVVDQILNKSFYYKINKIGVDLFEETEGVCSNI